MRTYQHRVAACLRCHHTREILARNLCGSCYSTEQSAERLDNWPLMRPWGPRFPPPPPPDPNLPPIPRVLLCGWCGAALTRSRTDGGEPLYEVYTVAGSIVAVCFENCPADRVLELTEVRSDG